MVYDTVKIEKINETYIRIYCSDSTAFEINNEFTFEIPGWRYMPAAKHGWDGRARLFDQRTHIIYAGLRQEVERFCKERDYAVEHLSDFNDAEYSVLEAKEHVENLFLPSDRQPRDYQLEALIKCVRRKRCVTILPTSSGKSLCIYMLATHYHGKKLIIVPTLNLIHQLSSDFVSYRCPEDRIHKVFSGQEKKSVRDIWVSTWQSIAKMPKQWFEQFECVIVDECHLAKATSIRNILCKMNKCQYRFGFSGTLDGTQVNELVLTGLFGPIRRGITTREMMDKGYSSKLKIKIIVLKHDPLSCERMVDVEYKDEVDYIISRNERNKFIKNLALSQEKNTLVLYRYIEKHGKILFEMIRDAVKDDRKVFFVHGGVDGEDRDAIRAIVEKEDNAIIVASIATFATGTNIQNLHSIILATPLKARIATLQSIGRVLRKAEGKTGCTFIDIADDLSSKKYTNHALRHMITRADIYSKEHFSFKTYKITLPAEKESS